MMLWRESDVSGHLHACAAFCLSPLVKLLYRQARVPACAMIIIYAICQVLFNNLAKLYILLPEIMCVQYPEVLLVTPALRNILEPAGRCHPHSWLPRDHTNGRHLPFKLLLCTDLLISRILLCLIIPALHFRIFWIVFGALYHYLTFIFHDIFLLDYCWLFSMP